MSGENYRVCKKCLLRDMADKENYFSNLQVYLENLEPEVKAEKALYEERLEICKDCDMLLEAMCRSCGCYVELRAAVEKNTCPRKKW